MITLKDGAGVTNSKTVEFLDQFIKKGIVQKQCVLPYEIENLDAYLRHCCQTKGMKNALKGLKKTLD